MPQRAEGNRKRSPLNRRSRWTSTLLARLGIDTDSQIARKLGVSVAAVGQRRRRLEIPRSPDSRREGRRWTLKEEALLGELTDREVAQELGISLDSVARRRLELDIPGANGRGNRKPPEDLIGAQYVKAYRRGVRVADIARKHDRSHATVRRALRRYEARVESGRGASAQRRRKRAAS